jgi:hypothetical protein
VTVDRFYAYFVEVDPEAANAAPMMPGRTVAIDIDAIAS